jgi:hypothetical protein
MQGVSKKALQLKVFQMLLCGECYEKGVQTIHRSPLCRYLSVNVFVTLVTQQYWEYSCKALFETPVLSRI